VGVVDQLCLLFLVGSGFIKVELEALFLPFIIDGQSWENSVRHHLDVSASTNVESNGISSCLV